MIPKNRQNQYRPIAYGESTYDFEGRRQPSAFANATIDPEVVLRTYTTKDVFTKATGDTPDNTTRTLLILAAVGIVGTGVLIWLLGRRK
jgi:hypothetical protein